MGKKVVRKVCQSHDDNERASRAKYIESRVRLGPKRFYLDKEQLKIQTNIEGNFANELSMLVDIGELDIVTKRLSEFISI